MEKIEKYTQSNNEESDSTTITTTTTTTAPSSTKEAEEKYLKMIIQHDNVIQDLMNNTTLSIEQECVAVHVVETTIDNQEESQATTKIASDALEYIGKIPDSHRLIIYGGHSSGKSTLLRMLMYKMAKNIQQFGIIPIFVSCALLTQNYDDDLPFELQCIRGALFYFLFNL